MTQQLTNKSVVRAKSALYRQRRIALILLIVVALLGITLGLVLFFTSRTAFIDPTDETKYYVAKKDKLYVLMTTDGVVLPTTEGGNYVTTAGTIVYVDEETGDFSTVAAVLVEDGETIKFNVSDHAYDVLLYPLLERANIAEIRVHNENGSFAFKRADYIDPTTKESTVKFVIEDYPDLAVDQTILFATLVYCTGNTRTMLRLDTNRVKELGYAEYGLPEDTANAINYFVITANDEAKTTHKVIVGDEIPSGDGYFVRYEGRDAVYVLKELNESDYNGTYKQALLGRVEDYVVPPTASPNMDAQNYVDVTDFKLYHKNESSPFIAFTYTGSINKRNDTFYSSFPYVATGGLAGYSINSYSVDNTLYALFTWKPDKVVSLVPVDLEGGNAMNQWLASYGLDYDSYAYRFTFTFNKAREYNSDTGKELVKLSDQEKHTVLVSEKQEDGLYYVYNICYVYDEKTSDFTKMADGYNMVIALDESQLPFLFYTTKDWISEDLFTGNIAYMTEMYIKIAAGKADKYPEGYEETFTVDNSETLTQLEQEHSSSTQMNSSQLAVRDSKGKSLHAKQFKTFYQSLLYTMYSGYSSLSEAQQAAHKASGADGATLVIRIKYVLREYDKDTGRYEETGEIIEREYCFYENLSQPRQYYTTVNGEGDFYTVSSRIKKIINDIMKLYGTPETDPIKYDSLT